MNEMNVVHKMRLTVWPTIGTNSVVVAALLVTSVTRATVMESRAVTVHVGIQDRPFRLDETHAERPDFWKSGCTGSEQFIAMEELNNLEQEEKQEKEREKKREREGEAKAYTYRDG